MSGPGLGRQDASERAALAEGPENRCLRVAARKKADPGAVIGTGVASHPLRKEKSIGTPSRPRVAELPRRRQWVRARP
jgi:hypothetical protein